MSKTNPNAIEDLLGGLVDRLADRLAEKLEETLASLPPPPPVERLSRPRRKVDMTCRVEGCTSRSRGPRFGFICDEHRKRMGKRDQEAARLAWNARQKAA